VGGFEEKNQGGRYWTNEKKNGKRAQRLYNGFPSGEARAFKTSDRTGKKKKARLHMEFY